MHTLNKVKIYSFSDKKTPVKEPKSFDSNNFEEFGDRHCTICCIISSKSKISECKDMKFLTKIFEKMHLSIKSIFVINIQDKSDCDFVYLKSEFDFTKIYFFGENSLIKNIPVKLEKLIPTTVDGIDMILVDNVLELSRNSDVNYKALVWETIKKFQRKINE